MGFNSGFKGLKRHFNVYVCILGAGREFLIFRRPFVSNFLLTCKPNIRIILHIEVCMKSDDLYKFHCINKLAITSLYKEILMEILHSVQKCTSFLPCQQRLANTRWNASKRLCRCDCLFSCTVPKWQTMCRPTARRNVDATMAPHNCHLNGAK